MDPNTLLTAPEPATKREAAALHASIHGACKAIFAKGEDATTAELETFDKLSKRGDAVKALIEKMPTSAAMKAWGDDAEKFINDPARHVPQPSDSGKPKVLGVAPGGHVTLSAGRKALDESGPGIFGQKRYDEMCDPTYQKAFSEYVRKGQRMSGGAYKALESGLDDQGGYFVPPEMIGRMIERRMSPAHLRGKVDQVSTSRDAIVLLKKNYTGNSTDDVGGNIYSTGFRVTSTDEIPAANPSNPQDNQAAVDFSNYVGSVRVGVNTWMIEGFFSNNLLEDSGTDVQGKIEADFGQTIDQLYENMIINGPGGNLPRGIVPSILNAQPSYDPIPFATTGTAGTIKADDLMSLSELLPEQYDEAATFVYAKTKVGPTVRTLKDLQGRYLFGLGYQDSGMSAGRQQVINGYPVTWSQFMPSIATGNVPVIFGDLKAFTLVNRLGFSIKVLDQVRAQLNQTVLVGKVRFGGQVLEPFRLRGLKVA